MLYLRSLRRHINRLVKDGPVYFWDKWNEGAHATVQIGLNGIGLSKTNHIAHYISERGWVGKKLHTGLHS